MFKSNNSNLLQKLRDTQSKIKRCKKVMSQYECPKTDWRNSANIMKHLQNIMRGDTDVDILVKYGEIDFDYLEEFGTYLANLARYQKDTQKYQEELDKLKKQEQELKAALGIE